MNKKNIKIYFTNQKCPIKNTAHTLNIYHLCATTNLYKQPSLMRYVPQRAHKANIKIVNIQNNFQHKNMRLIRRIKVAALVICGWNEKERFPIRKILFIYTHIYLQNIFLSLLIHNRHRNMGTSWETFWRLQPYRALIRITSNNLLSV